MMLRVAAALLPLSLTACALQPTAPDTGSCPVSNAGGWRAWADLMPGPDRPKLWVVGRVTAPTGGWRISLESGPLQESYPATQQILLWAHPPSGAATQALVTHDLRGSFPYVQEIGTVVVRCGGEVLAVINPVEKAH